ncbi:MAG: hypothetical protein R2754_16980 [Microthrixaceae bacterium]
MLYSKANSGDPGEVAVEWLEAYKNNDPGAAWELLEPSQRNQIDKTRWSRCGFMEVAFQQGFAELGPGHNVDADTKAGVEVGLVKVDEPVIGNTSGDGFREYDLTPVVVRFTPPEGDFTEVQLEVLDGQYLTITDRRQSDDPLERDTRKP